MNYPALRLITLAAISCLALGACTTTAAAPSTTAPTGPVGIRIAVLPILDSLPMYVAQQEGLFTSQGIKVELISVPSGAERDQLIASGQADGMINELLSTMLYNKDQIQVQTVRFARAATTEIPLFSILASAKSDIQAVDGLKGVEIGISQGTVIEYLTDRLLQAEGFSEDEIKMIAVPKIPDRLALLGSGELKAAMLPEPASSLAVQQGARVILDDTRHPEYSFSVITFRKAVIDQNPDAVRKFLAAIEQAVQMINASPAKYNSLLSDQKIVPQPLIGSFQVPQFVTAGVPNQAQWEDTLTWAQDKGLIKVVLDYQASVNASFLP
ncbi:MAG: ABC transporter substrate-binding protein [Anaerolineales bacterium]|nr:ABC transporter substrate-binding protein [Anaerolineales bacterium]